jgi:flagellar basal body-associated protein FliL
VRPRCVSWGKKMKRPRILLIGLVFAIVVLALAAVGATTFGSEGWTWNEAGWTWDEAPPSPEGWTWDEAPAQAG